MVKFHEKYKGKIMFEQITSPTMQNISVSGLELERYQAFYLLGVESLPINPKQPYITWSGNTSALHNDEICFSPSISIDYQFFGLWSEPAKKIREKFVELLSTSIPSGFIDDRSEMDENNPAYPSYAIFFSTPFSELCSRYGTIDEVKEFVLEVLKPISEAIDELFTEEGEYRFDNDLLKPVTSNLPGLLSEQQVENFEETLYRSGVGNISSYGATRPHLETLVSKLSPEQVSKLCKPEKMPEDEQVMLVFAVRYGVSRKSAGLTALKSVKKNWGRLSQYTKTDILSEIKNATCNKKEWDSLTELEL